MRLLLFLLTRLSGAAISQHQFMVQPVQLANCADAALSADGISRWCPCGGTERGVEMALIGPWGGTGDGASVPWDGPIDVPPVP
jgi:hypothetical protein